MVAQWKDPFLAILKENTLMVVFQEKPIIGSSFGKLFSSPLPFPLVWSISYL